MTMMGPLRRLVARIRYRRFAADVAEELRTHRAMVDDALRAQGTAARERQGATSRAMGNELHAREDARAAWVAPWLDHTTQDIRYAWRQIPRAPAFSVTAVLLAALGVGATTAVFSVVNAVLVTPLPYPDSDRILALGTDDAAGTDGPTFHAVLDSPEVFSAVAAQRRTGGASLVAGDEAVPVDVLRVSERYFAVLGVAPHLGRGFVTAEDRVGGPDVVVLSDQLWQRLWAGRPDIVGQRVVLGGLPHEVIGVMPSGFHAVPAADVWTPLRLSPADNSVNYLVTGRLNSGASPSAANAALDVAKATLMASQPAPLHQRTRSLQWTPLRTVLGRELSLPLLLTVLAVAATTAVACTNLAGLFLVRTLARSHEIATRLALGSSPGRLVRQFATESLVLAALGGLLAVTVVAWSTPALTRVIPASLLAGRAIQIDLRVLLAAAVATMAVGVAFGLAPALTARRVDLRAVVGSGRGATGSRWSVWSRRGLVLGEVAATALLLIVGGMLVTSLVRMYRADLGFDPSHVTVGRLPMAGPGLAEPARLRGLTERALNRLRATPGVEFAAVANAVPVERGLNLPVDASTGDQGHRVRSVDWRYVSPEYFAALRMSFHAGRAFDARDGTGGAPAAIVNRAFAMAYFGREQVLSQQLRMEQSLGDTPRTIVGVVQDSVSPPGAGWTRGINARGAAAPPIVYVPLAQAPARALAITHQFFPAAWIVRTRPGTGDIAPALRRAVHEGDASLAFLDVQPLADVVDADVQGARTITGLVSTLAVLSSLIAAVGIFGVVAYTTRMRRHETAIRLALGATRSGVVRASVHDIVAAAGFGIVIGLGSSVGTAGLIQRFVGPLASLEPTVLLAAIGVLIVAVGVPAAWPAIQASAADPLQSLRDQ